MAMKRPLILLFLLLWLTVSAQEPQVPLLTPDDFSPPAGTPLLNRVFPGKNPERGEWISGSAAALSFGVTLGAAYYGFYQASEDPFSTEVQQSAGVALTGLICTGLSLVVMDYFRDISDPQE